MTTKHSKNSIIERVKNWLEQYIIFPEDFQSTVVATWAIATHMHQMFAAFGYLAINARTKRAGKSRLGVELLRHIVSVGKAQTAPSPAGILRDITNLHATLIFDESESMSSESKDLMHALMNAGYKKGQVITRAKGPDESVDYEIYGPKLFILIGDANDTLRDRSFIITLERSLNDPPREYLEEEVLEEGPKLKEEIAELVNVNSHAIYELYKAERAKYLVSSRDEEIWRSLLAVARFFDINAYEMLKRAATDMSVMKTAPAIHIDLDHEKLMEQVEYSRKLIKDCVTIHGSLKDNDIRKQGIKNTELLQALLELDLSPWRRFRGVGLDLNTMTELLKAGGTLIGTSNKSQSVITVPIRRGKKNKGQGQEVIRGYKWEQILAAASKGSDIQ